VEALQCCRSFKYEKRGLVVLFEDPEGIRVLAEDRFDLGCGSVAAADPDDLGRVPCEETSLMEIRVFREERF
jgi:hypothetical protein